MKITVKLDKRKQGETQDGFPVVVYASQNYKNKAIRTGFFSRPSHWDDRLGQPRAKHPDYYLLTDYLEALKKKISKVILLSSARAVTLAELPKLLFQKDFNTFYDAATDSLPHGYTGSKYSAIESFNGFYPGIGFSEVSKATVESYKNKLLAKGNKPAGVDSYLRSLRAVWNQVTDKPNPFSGYKLEIPTKINTVATDADLIKLAGADLPYRGDIGGHGQYRDYWLLMFYLGGIDPEVLSKLRYDVHLIGGRIHFNRDKGRSKTACNNLVPPQAFKILKRYNCDPYFVPIFMAGDYKTFLGNFNRRFKELCRKLELTAPLRPKGARYTFIDRAQQLLIDERITAQIVGHKRKTTTSLYTNDFPLHVQDAAQMKIIDF